jgi:hypothetical protein
MVKGCEYNTDIHKLYMGLKQTYGGISSDLCIAIMKEFGIQSNLDWP